MGSHDNSLFALGFVPARLTIKSNINIREKIKIKSAVFDDVTHDSLW